MSSTRPPDLVRRGRLWALITYPVRLGPSRPERPRGAFARMATVHALSSAGDAWVTVALAGSVFVSVSLHAARGKTALGLVCTVLPFLLVGPFVGPAIDRIRGGRRAMVAATAVGRLVACGVMAAVIHTLWLFPAAFASLVCSKTYLVAKASLVPSAVERDEDLVEANSKLAVGASVVTSLAAVVGAGIYKVFGSGAVLHLDMVLLGVCAVLAMRLRPSRTARLPGRRRPAPVCAPMPPPKLRGYSRTGGLRSRRSRSRGLPPGGLALAAMTMTAMRAVAGMMTALVLFAFRRNGTPLIWYGLVGVASVVGNLGGASLAPLVRDRIPEERIVPAAAVIIGVVAVFATQLPAHHYRLAAMLVAATVGVGASVAKMAFDAIVQRDPPEVARSRLFARFEAVFQLGWVVAALLPVLVSLSLAAGFVIIAALTLGSGLVFVIGWHQARAGTLPSWWPGGNKPPADSPADLGPSSALGGPVGLGPADPTKVYPGGGGG